MVHVVDTKEKGSDVNLATYLLVDAFDRDFEVAVVVSNDSDLVTPIDVVQSKFGLPVRVLNPHRDSSSSELRNTVEFFQPIWEQRLRACQFPPTLRDAHGTITKPKGW